jgi:hypothetical protein
MFVLPRQHFGQPGKTEGAPARTARWASKSFAKAGNGLFVGSLRRQGGPPKKTGLLSERKSLPRDQILGCAESLQCQLRLAPEEVKHSALSQGELQAERMTDALGQRQRFSADP